MTTVRVIKDKSFSSISNKAIQDKRLSLKARGLLVYMLSLPEDWDYSVAGLVVSTNEGKHSITECLKALEEAGYLRRKQLKASGGKFGKNEYVIYEQPLTENPSTEKLLTEKPLTENQPQQNTNKQNTKKQNTNTTNMAGGVLVLEQEQLGKLVDFWNINIRPISPYEFESLKDLMTDFGYNNVLEAVKIAAENNAKKISYVKSVAENLYNGKDFRQSKQPEPEKPKKTEAELELYRRTEERIKRLKASGQ